MKQEEVKELARRLETISSMSNAQREAVLNDLVRYAKTDLYSAARLARDHAPTGSEIRLPAVIRAAREIATHFEGRMREQLRPILLEGGQGQRIRQPDDGREYCGPVVGKTGNCLVQLDRETGDLVVHARHTLNRSFEMSGTDDAFSIKYSFRAIGGIGLVRPIDHHMQEEPRMQHANKQIGEKTHSMDHTR